MAILAVSIGSALLPTLNSIVGVFGQAASSLAGFAEKHPTLIKYIGMAVAGLGSFKIASFALGYGFTFLKGGVLSIMGIFTQARTAFSLVRLGLSALIPIIKSVGAAFLTNPLTLIIAGIAVGALLLIKYWKPISEFFKKLFEPVVEVFKNVWNWIVNLWNKAKEIFSGIKEWVKDSWVGKAWNWAFGGSSDKEPETPKVGDTVSSVVNQISATPAVELPRSEISKTATSTVSVNAPITINASPGMSAEDVANTVAAELNAREEQASRRERSANYD